MTNENKILTKQPKEKHRIKSAIYCTEMTIGIWKKKVPTGHRALIILEALNHCVDHEKLKLKVMGYLITSRRIFLVVESTHILINDVFKMFDKQVEKGVKNYLNRENVFFDDDNEFENKHHVFGNLFNKRPLYRNDIYRIITGRSPDIKYYSPHLAKFKDLIENYNLCSVKDYLGASSPVGVTLRPKIFWEEDLKRTKELNEFWVEYSIKKHRNYET